jgi:hypothetical protein
MRSLTPKPTTSTERKASFPQGAFLKKLYRQRSKIESIFSAVNRKLSTRALGRSLASQILQALLIGLAYNIYRLWHPQRMSTEPVLQTKDSHHRDSAAKSFRCNTYKNMKGGVIA